MPASVQEVASASPRRRGVAPDTFCLAGSDSCGRCGSSESGSASISPRRSSTASADSSSERPGVHPGRCDFAEGFIPPLLTGNHCGSFQSFLAMGLLRIWASGAFDAGHGRRRSSPTRMARTEAWVFLVIFALSRGFFACVVGQLSLFPVVPYLYSYVSLYVFLTLQKIW